MNSTRQQLIAAGKVWQICTDAEPDKVLHECQSRFACMKWLKENRHFRGYKTGVMRIGRVIWEPTN